MTGQMLIYSNHHKSWWGPGGSGYSTSVDNAGLYDPADTGQWLGRDCGCCLVPEILVPAPSAEVLADPDTTALWSRIARATATRKAKKAGRTNPYAEVMAR
jgi:hypothetical protein